MSGDKPVYQWMFRARVREVVNSDTIEVEVDLGFSVRTVVRLALDGVAALDPESDAGRYVASYIDAWCRDAAWRDTLRPEDEGTATGWPIFVETAPSVIHGRYRATVWNLHGDNLNNYIRSLAEIPKPD